MTEVTLLQLHAEKLGVMIDCSPKCHPEIAGEGIEYVWSLAKLKYCFMRIIAKRSTKGFHDAIATATSTDNLTKIKIRKCSKRARRYMLAYWAFQAVDKDEQQPDANNNAEHITHLTHKVIEKAIKTYKRHRTVDNIDPKWIKNLMLEKKSDSSAKSCQEDDNIFVGVKIHKPIFWIILDYFSYIRYFVLDVRDCTPYHLGMQGAVNWKTGAI